MWFDNTPFTGLSLKVGQGRGKRDLGTQGRGDAGTWYARTSELRDVQGFEDVINK